MTEDDIRRAFLEELVTIAPDLDPQTVSGTDHLQDDLELDSMDVLNLVIALSKRFSIDIPEADYPDIATADRAVDYIGKRV